MENILISLLNKKTKPGRIITPTHFRKKVTFEEKGTVDRQTTVTLHEEGQTPFDVVFQKADPFKRVFKEFTENEMELPKVPTTFLELATKHTWWVFLKAMLICDFTVDDVEISVEDKEVRIVNEGVDSVWKFETYDLPTEEVARNDYGQEGMRKAVKDDYGNYNGYTTISFNDQHPDLGNIYVDGLIKTFKLAENHDERLVDSVCTFLAIAIDNTFFHSSYINSYMVLYCWLRQRFSKGEKISLELINLGFTRSHEYCVGEGEDAWYLYSMFFPTQKAYVYKDLFNSVELAARKSVFGMQPVTNQIAFFGYPELGKQLHELYSLSEDDKAELIWIGDDLTEAQVNIAKDVPPEIDYASIQSIVVEVPIEELKEKLIANYFDGFYIPLETSAWGLTYGIDRIDHTNIFENNGAIIQYVNNFFLPDNEFKTALAKINGISLTRAFDLFAFFQLDEKDQLILTLDYKANARTSTRMKDMDFSVTYRFTHSGLSKDFHVEKSEWQQEMDFNSIQQAKWPDVNAEGYDEYLSDTDYWIVMFTLGMKYHIDSGTSRYLIEDRNHNEELLTITETQLTAPLAGKNVIIK